MRLSDQFTVSSEWHATLPTRFTQGRITATAVRWSAPKVL
jgi:hypothetical protein